VSHRIALDHINI